MAELAVPLPTPESYTNAAFTGATLGIGAWAVDTAFKHVQSHITIAHLSVWTAAGVASGLFVALALRLAPKLRQRQSSRATPIIPKRVLILGGGFAGASTAQALEQQLGPDGSIDITLISETNALLFTPMLAEVAASSIEPTHMNTPLRSMLRRTNVIRAKVEALDSTQRFITLGDGRTMSYDHVVLALGSTANFFGQEGVRNHALTLRTLGDAMRIRNRMIDLLERADREPDELRRRQLLTVVVAGGGFAGAELAGGLNDFARGALVDYTNVNPDDLKVIVVHAGEHILPELGSSLGLYAQERMTARGVDFRLNTKVADATEQSVTLADGTVIDAQTLIWTAGVKPHALGTAASLATNQRGAVIVDEFFRAGTATNIWALGDCAAAIDPTKGKPYPPTAQVAIRQAKVVAHNIIATVRGQACIEPSFADLGALCVVGHRTACAELKVPFAPGGVLRFSGTFAWLMWRGIYLAKLPGIDRKVRVLFDWVTELFFPRDIVQTLELS